MRSQYLSYCLYVWLAAGCGPVQSYQRTIPERALAEMPPPAKTYRSVPQASVAAGKEEGALLEAVLAQLPAAYRQGLIRDRRLDGAVRTMAWTHVVGQKSLAVDLKRWIVEHHGAHWVGRHWTRMRWNSMGRDAKGRLLERIRGGWDLHKLSMHQGQHRFGFSLVQTGARSWACALIIAEDRVVLEPFERVVTPGGQITIRGRVKANWRGIKLFYFVAPGIAKYVPIKPDKTGRFEVAVTAPKVPGVYTYEIRARRYEPRPGGMAYGRRLLAAFSGYVGVPIATKPALGKHRGEPSFDEVSGPRLFIDKLNSARVSLGLDPLRRLSEVTGAAATVAKESVSRRRLKVHDVEASLPKTHREAERLAKWTQVYDVVALARSYLASPSVAAYALHPKTYGVGVGLHRGTKKNGDPKWRIGVLFFKARTTKN